MQLYELDTDLLSRIVHWAVLDEQHLSNTHPVFSNWGSWNQGLWATPRGLDEETTEMVEANSEYNPHILTIADPNICGTAFCIAGQVAAQTGQAFIFDGTEDSAETCGPRIPLGLDEKGRTRYGPDVSQRKNIAQHAREVLGLIPAESRVLFSGSNEIEVIVFLASKFAEMRGVSLDLEPGILALADDVGDYWQNNWRWDIYDGCDMADIEVIPNPHRYVAPERPVPARTT